MTRPRAVALTIGIWTLVGLLTSELSVLAVERSGAAAPIRNIFLANLVSVWIWAAFTPAMVYMARRFPPGESRWPNWVLPHLAGAVALGVADVVFERGVWLLLAPAMPGTDMVVA